jgi:hypothetical protein
LVKRIATRLEEDCQSLKKEIAVEDTRIAALMTSNEEIASRINLLLI